MQLEKRFTIQDFLVTIICIVGLYFSLDLFYGVMNQSLDKINEEPIGTISFKYKSAQRKLLDRVLWDRVKQNSPVYNGDIIRTAELSEATVTFIDGNVIDLYEQTLAQIFLDIEEGTAIDFTGGGVALDTSGAANGMTLTTGNANVQVEAGAKLNAVAPTADAEGNAQAGQLSLQVTSGQVNLVSADGTQTEITEGGGVIFDEASNTFVPPALTVVSPPSNAKYITQSEAIPINFTWEKQNIDSSEYIILETSPDRNFEEIVEQISFTNVENIALDIGEGTWYWRVYTQSQSSVISGKLQVVQSPTPVATVPAQGAEFSYRTKSPSVRFMWNEDDYARAWRFEVSDNEQMSNPLISQTSSQPSVIINSLTEGRYYWTVTPMYPTSFLGQELLTSATSAVNYFDVVAQGSLTQAELVLPLKGGFIDSTKPEAGYHFTWKYDFEATDYTIAISRNANLSSPTVEETIGDNYYILYPEVATLGEGQWYWGVTKTDSEGNISPQSEIRSLFSVQGRVEQRTLFPPDGYSLSENLVVDTSFTWKTNLPFTTKFQVSQDDRFSTIHAERLVNTSSVSGLSLPVGTWYWRIIADTSGSSVTYQTEPKELHIGSYLDKVNVTNVQNNSNVVVRPFTPVDFEWDAVNGAQYYQVRLFSADDQNTPVYENLIVENTAISVDMEDLSDGRYVLTLRAMATETDMSSRKTGLLTVLSFDMKHLVPISLNTPNNGSSIDGLDAIIRPGTLEWSSVEQPETSRLILTSNNLGLDFDDRSVGIEPVERSMYISEENPSTVFNLPALPDGTWYWTVIAQTAEGFDITPLEPSSFVVTPIEPFDILQGVQPDTLQTLNVEFFRQQRHIDFSWNAVDEADGYVFRITDTTGATMFEETINDATSYRFEDFSMIGKGNFTWSLEAIMRLPNGAIVRRGRREEKDFIVDLPSISGPSEQTTGELYGL